MTYEHAYDDPEYFAAARERMRAECLAQGLPEFITDPVEAAWLNSIVYSPSTFSKTEQREMETCNNRTSD